MNAKKIVIDGNSVAVRVSPTIRGNQSYSNLLHQEYLDVDIRAHSGKTLSYVSRCPDQLYNSFPDVIILNFGIVEICSRSVGLGLYKYIYLKEKRTKVGFIMEAILEKIESTFRKLMVFLRFKRSWYSTNRFLRIYNELIDNIQKKSEAKIICLGINTPSERVEKQASGTLKRVELVNHALELICNDKNNVWFIGTTDISPELIPDGIHFDNLGHQIIYDRIKRKI